MEQRVKVKDIKCAVVLVAGDGKRLRPFTEKQPKCFAEIANKRILENTLEALAGYGCTKVFVVVGHFAQHIQDIIGSHFSGMKIHYIDNPIYELTNSMYSLSLGLERISEPTWVIEGDVFLEESILAIKHPDAEISWYVDSSVRHLDGAFLKSGADSRALSLDIIRDLQLLRSDQFKSMGMLKLNTDGVARLSSWLRQGIRDKRQNDYYDLIVADRLSEIRVQLVDVAGYKWYEIDTAGDLEEARKMFQ
jgi:choline kinase